MLVLWATSILISISQYVLFPCYLRYTYVWRFNDRKTFIKLTLKKQKVFIGGSIYQDLWNLDFAGSILFLGCRCFPKIS